MNYRIKQIVSESKIVGFVASFNKNMLIYFHKSKTYEVFLSIISFFRRWVLKNVDKSLIVRMARNIYNHTTLKYIGVFIILVDVFNTAIMAFLKKRIDIFSSSARVFFFILGLMLIYCGRKR